MFFLSAALYFTGAHVIFVGNCSNKQKKMKKSDFMVLEKLFEMQREAYIGQLKILHKSAEMVGNCITVNPLTNRNSFDVSKQGQVNKTAVKSKLMHLVNGDLVLTSKSCVLDFICLFPGACTEDARVGLLLVLRASEKRTAFGKSLVEDFQNKKGMSILKVWLMESHDCAQDDVVKMILNVLLEIKWSMALILKSKIVDVVRRVKKDTENKSLKSSAADVLKLWKKQHSEQVMMEEKKDAEERKKKADDVLGTLLTQEAPKAKPKVVRKEIPNPVAKVIPPVKVPEKPPVTVVDNPLPTIQSFGKHTTKGTGPKIRWADEHGKPLEHIRFIQSREEQQKMVRWIVQMLYIYTCRVILKMRKNVNTIPNVDSQGKIHINLYRIAPSIILYRSQRKTDPSKQAVQLQWYTPRKLDLPTDCPYLTKPINTQEMKTQVYPYMLFILM